MKRLILMRHAKSDWSGGAGSDHERPLNARGRKGADALGQWLRDQGVLPDQVLCSSAERTGETCLRLGLAPDTPSTFTRKLYLAPPEAILNALRSASGACVLMIAHNPGIAIAAAEIVGTRPAHPKFDQYPTGATLVADFDMSNWQEADWGNAIARHFVVPRDL
jgi:phosphohistidine phosphatase